MIREWRSDLLGNGVSVSMAAQAYRLLRAVLMIRVRQAFTEVRGVGLVVGPPKSRAGLRAVTVPAVILPALREHLAAFVDAGPTALVFTGPSGAPIWRGNFNKLVRWSAAVEKVGVPGLHFHDLRHTRNGRG